MKILESHIGRNHFIYNGDLLDKLDKKIFKRKKLKKVFKKNRQGRGTATFFEHHSLPMVLKRYNRGGMLRHFIQQYYLFIGCRHVRMWQEFLLLSQLNQMQLPVPVPIAGRAKFKGPYYRGELITQQILNSETLAQRLEKRSIEKKLWYNIGKTIKRFHDLQVYHADLNANNILLDKNDDIYLIDFDKGKIIPNQHTWKEKNLLRLLRSLNKIASIEDTFHFDNKDWDQLLAGYRGIID